MELQFLGLQKGLSTFKKISIIETWIFFLFQSGNFKQNV